MGRTYDNPDQAIYDELRNIRAESVQTNNLLLMILEHLRMQPAAGAPGGAGKEQG